MAAEKPIRVRAGKRAAKRGAAREAEVAPPTAPERGFVDIDPWAVLLELDAQAPDMLGAVTAGKACASN